MKRHFGVVAAAIHRRLLGPPNKSPGNLADHKRGIRIYNWTLNKSAPRNAGPDRKGKRPWRKVMPPERCTTTD